MKRFYLATALIILPFVISTPAMSASVATGSAAPNRVEDTTSPSGNAGDRQLKRFQAMDQNKDGIISAEEWNVYHAEQSQKRFEKLDVNKDGKVSSEEFAAGRNKRTKDKDGKRGNAPRD